MMVPGLMNDAAGDSKRSALERCVPCSTYRCCVQAHDSVTDWRLHIDLGAELAETGCFYGNLGAMLFGLTLCMVRGCCFDWLVDHYLDALCKSLTAY